MEYTQGREFLLPDGTFYIGYYNTLPDGTITTGKYYSKNSKILVSTIDYQSKFSPTEVEDYTTFKDIFRSSENLVYTITKSKVGEIEKVYIGVTQERSSVVEGQNKNLYSKEQILKLQPSIIKLNKKGIITLNVEAIKVNNEDVVKEQFFNIKPEKFLVRDDELLEIYDRNFQYFIDQEIVGLEGLYPKGSFLRFVEEGVKDLREYTYYFVHHGNTLCKVPNYQTLEVMLVERNTVYQGVYKVEAGDKLEFYIEGECPDRFSEWIERFGPESGYILPGEIEFDNLLDAAAEIAEKIAEAIPEPPAFIQGEPGEAGAAGSAGEAGAAGAAGSAGSDGKDGQSGDSGPAGRDGKDGKDGKDGTTTVVVNVSSDGKTTTTTTTEEGGGGGGGGSSSGGGDSEDDDTDSETDDEDTDTDSETDDEDTTTDTGEETDSEEEEETGTSDWSVSLSPSSTTITYQPNSPSPSRSSVDFSLGLKGVSTGAINIIWFLNGNPISTGNPTGFSMNVPNKSGNTLPPGATVSVEVTYNEDIKTASATVQYAMTAEKGSWSLDIGQDSITTITYDSDGRNPSPSTVKFYASITVTGDASKADIEKSISWTSSGGSFGGNSTQATFIALPSYPGDGSTASVTATTNYMGQSKSATAKIQFRKTGGGSRDTTSGGSKSTGTGTGATGSTGTTSGGTEGNTTDFPINKPPFVE